MTPRATLLILLAAALVQNLAEGWFGGPALPDALASWLPNDQKPWAALILISVVLAGLILPAAIRQTRKSMAVASLAAGGLLSNAVLQLIGSAAVGRLIPGTLIGAVLMLPAAVAVLLMQGRSAILPALVGVALSPLILLLTWHLAARLPL